VLSCESLTDGVGQKSSGGRQDYPISFRSECRTNKALAFDSEVGGVETGSDGLDDKIATFHIELPQTT
jgi:hypothetical protein